MADNTMNQNQNDKRQDESMKREQGQPMTGERRPEQGSDKDRQKEEGREKSAIGGSPSGQSPSGQQSGQSPAGQNKEFDKNRSEPTSR